MSGNASLPSATRALVGRWSMLTWTRTNTATGNLSDAFGANPRGHRIRLLRMDGNTLTLTSAPARSPVDGQECIHTITFEKVG